MCASAGASARDDQLRIEGWHSAASSQSSALWPIPPLLAQPAIASRAATIAPPRMSPNYFVAKLAVPKPSSRPDRGPAIVRAKR